MWTGSRNEAVESRKLKVWTASETTDDDESGDKFGAVDGVLVAKILSFSNLNGLLLQLFLCYYVLSKSSNVSM